MANAMSSSATTASLYSTRPIPHIPESGSLFTSYIVMRVCVSNATDLTTPASAARIPEHGLKCRTLYHTGHPTGYRARGGWGDSSVLGAAFAIPLVAAAASSSSSSSVAAAAARLESLEGEVLSSLRNFFLPSPMRRL